LWADPKVAESWGKRLPKDERIKVGLCWSGSPKHLQDRVRSFTPEDLSPLSEVKEAWYCSLRKAPDGQASERFPEGMHIVDWTGDLTDFAETAGLIASLDLVISCDTAVAHLAGAMGKPVWLLLPLVPDWRWMLEREDSPWYPTMRIFRQGKPGDWQGPVREAVETMKKLDRKKRRDGSAQ
jgi:hypothetical protein